MTLVEKSLSQKPVDKPEETNTELSQYSSISTLANLWTAKRLSCGKNLEISTKRHRFPPSLLTSKAADFWNTLLLFRENCSCSSVSVSDKCSRSSIGVSISDVIVGSNSDSSVPLVEEITTVGKTLGDTLEQTHLAFELLIARMVRLLNILNEKSGSSLSHICSVPHLKIFQPTNPEERKITEMITEDSSSRFPSIASIPSNSNKYKDQWSSETIGKRRESFSKFDTSEQKRLSGRFFSRTLVVPKSLRVPKSLLTKEEMVYLLGYKKSLLSEYFHSEADSKDLKKSPDFSERKNLIYETQSDSRLHDDNLHQFVKFIRERRKKDAEDVPEKKCHSLGTQKSDTNLFLPSLNKEESRNISTTKRRVTFCDPLPKRNTILKNSFSSDNEDGILSAPNFITPITNDVEIPNRKNIRSIAAFDSESTSPSASSVSLKPCFANLSLKYLSTKGHDPNSDLIFIKSSMKQTDCEKNIPAKILDSAQSECTNEIEALEKANSVSVQMTVIKSQPDENEDFLNNSSSSVSPRLSRNSSKSDISYGEEMIEGEKHVRLKFLVKEILDCGTTHLPMLDDVGPSVILKVDETTPRVIFEEWSPEQNSVKCLKRNVCPIEIRENYHSPDDDYHHISDRELEDRKMINKKTILNTIRQSGMPPQSDTDINNRPSWPSGKTVTFQDDCKGGSKQSIISDQKEVEPLVPFDDKSVASSTSNGRFELSWKGCWDQRSTTNSVQSGDQSEDQSEANSTDGEEQLVDSNVTEIMSEDVVLTPIEILQNDLELSSAISGSQTTYYTTMEDEIELENDCRSRYRSRSLRAALPSSYSDPARTPSFTDIAASLEKDEMIPWMVESKEEPSKSSEPVSKLNYSLESNVEALKLRNRAKLRRELADVYTGIRYPEIWRSEVRTEPKSLSKSEWYEYPWKTPGMGSDWLIRKLEELQSSPETDCESDYYAESEVESDYEYGKDLTLMRRSFSNIDTRSENCRRFKRKRKRFRPDLFLNKVWSSKKIVFNECRCHKNTPRKRYDPRPRDRDLRHTAFHKSRQLSNQNFFSHLRARLIVDSETDDSDFASSIRSDFGYDFNNKDEHVNKMKSRRFVRSLKSIRSEEGRQFSSPKLLRVTFKKSCSPVSVQSAFSTRTVGTNVSGKQNHCDTRDVCTDTSDLCPPKPIGTTDQASDLTFSNKNSSCQTVESFFETSSSFQCTKDVPETPMTTVDIDNPLGSDFQVSRSNGQRISSALASLSTQINNASNNLAKLRFSEIRTEPEKVAIPSALEEDNISTSPKSQSTPLNRWGLSAVVKTFDAVVNKSDSYTVENSSCSICNARKKPTGRYALPSCIVKGPGPDSKRNEKDPWNRVMAQAKAQHRHEGRNTSTCSEMRQVAISGHDSAPLRSSERKQNSSVNNNQSEMEEVRVHLVQVKNNSCQAAVSDLKYPTVNDKITSPLRIERRFALPPASAIRYPKSSDFMVPNNPRMRSPKSNKKPSVVPNKSNRLLYIISETVELTNQMPIKSAAANFFT